MKTDTVVLSSNTEVVKTENSSFDNFTRGNWRKSRVVCKSIFRGKNDATAIRLPSGDADIVNETKHN